VDPPREIPTPAGYLDLSLNCAVDPPSVAARSDMGDLTVLSWKPPAVATIVLPRQTNEADRAFARKHVEQRHAVLSQGPYPLYYTSLDEVRSTLAVQSFVVSGVEYLLVSFVMLHTGEWIGPSSTMFRRRAGRWQAVSEAIFSGVPVDDYTGDGFPELIGNPAASNCVQVFEVNERLRLLGGWEGDCPS
jgi:hypothetical protein